MVRRLFLSILACLTLVSIVYSAEFDANSDGVFDEAYKFKVDNLVHTSTTAVSANVITLLSQADFAGMRTQLGVQASDAELSAIAGLTFADVSVIELTGASAAGVVTSTGNNYFLKSNSSNAALEFASPEDAISALDADLVIAATADEAGASKYFGTDGDGVVGFHTYSTTGLGFDVAAPGAAGALLKSDGSGWARVTTLTNFSITGFSTTTGTAIVSDSVGALSQTFDSFLPDATDGASLGSSTVMWSDLFLASGGVINFNNGNATLTHSAGLLTSNVPLSLGTSNALTAGSVEVGAASDTTLARTGAGVLAVEGKTLPRIIASGAKALNFGSTATGQCATVITDTATGALSTDVVIFNANASIKAVTGFVPASTGGFSIAAFPSTDLVSFEACNWTSDTVDPGSITVNWMIIR